MGGGGEKSEVGVGGWRQGVGAGGGGGVARTFK